MLEGWQAGISADVGEQLFAVAFGFAFAGLCASGCRLVGLHRPGLRMLEAGPMVGRLAAVPLLIFSAPYLIMRNTLRRDSPERRRGDLKLLIFLLVMLQLCRVTRRQRPPSASALRYRLSFRRDDHNDQMS